MYINDRFAAKKFKPDNTEEIEDLHSRLQQLEMRNTELEVILKNHNTASTPVHHQIQAESIAVGHNNNLFNSIFSKPNGTFNGGNWQKHHMPASAYPVNEGHHITQQIIGLPPTFSSVTDPSVQSQLALPTDTVVLGKFNQNAAVRPHPQMISGAGTSFIQNNQNTLVQNNTNLYQPINLVNISSAASIPLLRPENIAQHRGNMPPGILVVSEGKISYVLPRQAASNSSNPNTIPVYPKRRAGPVVDYVLTKDQIKECGPGKVLIMQPSSVMTGLSQEHQAMVVVSKTPSTSERAPVSRSKKQRPLRPKPSTGTDGSLKTPIDERLTKPMTSDKKRARSGRSTIKNEASGEHQSGKYRSARQQARNAHNNERLPAVANSVPRTVPLRRASSACLITDLSNLSPMASSHSELSNPAWSPYIDSCKATTATTGIINSTAYHQAPPNTPANVSSFGTQCGSSSTTAAQGLVVASSTGCCPGTVESGQTHTDTTTSSMQRLSRNPYTCITVPKMCTLASAFSSGGVTQDLFDLKLEDNYFAIPVQHIPNNVISMTCSAFKRRRNLQTTKSDRRTAGLRGKMQPGSLKHRRRNQEVHPTRSNRPNAVNRIDAQVKTIRENETTSIRAVGKLGMFGNVRQNIQTTKTHQIQPTQWDKMEASRSRPIRTTKTEQIQAVESHPTRAGETHPNKGTETRPIQATEMHSTQANKTIGTAETGPIEDSQLNSIQSEAVMSKLSTTTTTTKLERAPG